MIEASRGRGPSTYPLACLGLFKGLKYVGSFDLISFGALLV